VPEGSYRHDDGTVEAFRCAPGPAGWRYAAVVAGGRVDVTVDGLGRQLRVEVVAGAWRLRGGVAGAHTRWLRVATAPSIDDATEHSASAAGFTGRSPGLLVATAWKLRLTSGEAIRVRLAEITEPFLAVRLTTQEWTLAGVDRHDGLDIAHYRIADLDTGEPAEVSLAGDVVLSGPGVELMALDGPPSAAPSANVTNPGGGGS